MKIKYIDRKTGQIKIENPPAEKMLRFLYDNPFGRKAMLPLIKKKFISDFYGKKMNERSSVKRIASFVETLNINMEESEKSISDFTSFNDFFYRKLKKNARKIQEGLISPGDGKILAFERVREVNEFFVKGQGFTLAKFLSDTEMAKKYQNHSMIILRLAPNDYHRYHFPYEGIPSLSRFIKGNYYSVSPIALLKNFAKVFCENKRECCILKTKNRGDILIVPVGATMVGSIISTYTEEQFVEKGDEMGYFAFGGSTIVLLVDSTKFRLDSDIVENTKKHIETYVQMGERIAGEFNGN